MAIISLMLWVKLLFFMRLFRKTGYLVYSIVTVIKDMMTFLLIFCIVMIGFVFAFISLALECNFYDKGNNCPITDDDNMWDAFK